MAIKYFSVKEACMETVEKLLREMNDLAIELDGKDSDVIQEAMKLIINHFNKEENVEK